MAIDHQRDPWYTFFDSYHRVSPWRILEDAGGAFAMGGIGGALFHSIKGFRNSPRGERLAGSIMAMACCLCLNPICWASLSSSSSDISKKFKINFSPGPI